MIGDPSGRSATRPRLTEEEVKTNAQTYLDQVYKILDEEKTRVVYNSSWLSPLTFSNVIELSAKYSVARMLERDDFKKRFKAITEDAEIECTIHELRHTFASQLAIAGVSIYKISKWLGHASIKTTEIYAHLTPNDDDIGRF